MKVTLATITPQGTQILYVQPDACDGKVMRDVYGEGGSVNQKGKENVE